MLNEVKERIKKNQYIVAMYEGSVNGYYKMRTKIFEEIRKYRPIHYGDNNRSKIFFRISFEPSNLGVFSLIFEIMIPYIRFALRHGWIPVIDLKGMYIPLIQNEDKKDVENSWEYYFEQPIKEFTLEDVYHSKNVLEAKWWFRKVKEPEWATLFPCDKKKLRYWHGFIKSYIRLNDDIEERVAIEKKKIFKQGQKVLGVGIRAGLRSGAMRNKELFNGHPKQPTCEEMMELVKHKMQEWNCSCIFLAIDDREYFNKFINKFGDRCCYLNRRLAHYFENDIPADIMDILVEYEGISTRERTEEYIIETYLLAQCNSLYSCHGGGATFAYFLNGGEYEHVEVYDAGIYEGLGEKKTQVV